jgi:glycosyltransferase 2 family protein
MIAVLRTKRFWFTAIFGLAIFIYTIQRADFKRLVQGFHDFNQALAVLSVLSSVLSYLCIAAVLHRLLRGMGFHLTFATSFRISLVSTTINYIMAIGGLSGVAAKVYLLARENVPPSRTLSISMVHGFLTNTVALVFVYLGFFFLYSQYKMSVREKEVGVFVLLVAFALTWFTVQVILHEGFRKRLWQLLMRAATAISHRLHDPRWFHQDRAEGFFENFNESMNALVGNARILLAPATYALLDWFFMFFCLKWSFGAIGYPVDNYSLMVGFSMGIFAGLFSITPISIGIMEGSMAGSFYLMGLDYDRALLAVLLYRFSYFFLPTMASLFFFRHFVKSSAEELSLGKRNQKD